MVKRLLLALPLAAIGALWALFLFIPWPIRLRGDFPERTSFMEYRIRQAAVPNRPYELRYEPVPLERISKQLRRAVLVAEDARFYQHEGIDWSALREELRYGGDADFAWTDPADLRALLEALRYYREHREQIRGRSTLTQQLAKNLYFTPERSLVRKLEEFVVAKRLERLLGKDRILELYLNVAELGPGVFGAEAAARHYFGRSAAELTRDQAAALAATLPHPLTSNPATNPRRMAWRKRLILARMGAGGPVETVPLAPPAPIEIEAPAVEPLGREAEPAIPRTPPVGEVAPPLEDTVPAQPPPDTVGL